MPEERAKRGKGIDKTISLCAESTNASVLSTFLTRVLLIPPEKGRYTPLVTLESREEQAKQCYHQNTIKTHVNCFVHGYTGLKKGIEEMQQPNKNERKIRNNLPAANWNVEIPLSNPCQIYPRVSTPEQIKNVSAEMQKDKSFALSCGWTEDLIILDTRDLGVSGQLRMEDRLAFNEMLRRIAKGLIKAVVVVNVDRLFRNKWGDESGKFMEICFTYGVIVVTPDFIYDFRISWHIDRFKRRCEEAWNYLEYHVYGRLHPAQDARGYAGYWTGGNLPMGYILDMQEKIGKAKNPNHYRYIVYEPHAEVIRWIFRRFKQLNGNVTSLVREIVTKPVIFADFEESVSPFLVQAGYPQYTKVEGGYTIVSDRGLRNILVNRVYIGYWIYKKELISTENHEPIVDIDDFTYAYNRLSAVKLDGTPNECAVEGRGKRYRKKHFAEKPAILKDVIFADDPGVKIYTRDVKTTKGVHLTYGFWPEGVGRVRNSSTFTVVATELDRIILDRLIEHMLTEPETQQEFQNFIEVEEEVVDEVSETLKDIERDIKATKALMSRIKEQIRAGKFTEPDLAEEANESYRVAKDELQRLEVRKEDTTLIVKEDQERRDFKMLIREVGEAWDEIVMPEEYPRAVYLFIKSVTLAVVSPHFFSARIEWKDPTWNVDTGLCFKGSMPKSKWSDEEVKILLEHYETAPRKELLCLLPHRSYTCMRGYVAEHHLGLKRKSIRKEPDIPYHVSLRDWCVMQKYQLSEETVIKWEHAKLVAWDFLQRS